MLQGDVVHMRPLTLNEKTWDKAMVAKRLDEQSYLVATSKTEWIFERHKK